MSNKLPYWDDLEESGKYDNYESQATDFSREIAVAFGVFLGMKCTYINKSYYLYLGNSYTTKQLFDYWLKNIAYE